MITITVTADTANAHAFLVQVQGKIRRPRALHDRLARTLAAKLRDHFAARNQEPNKLGAPKTGFWEKVRAATVVGEVTDTGASVKIGVDTQFRIHLLGGIVKPVRAKLLTIPLIKEARGKTARVYESESGHKLFRLPGSMVLMERDSQGDRSTVRSERASMRTRSGTRVFNLSARTRVRPVYALADHADIPKDPRALPPGSELAAALQTAANDWAQREATRKGGEK